MTKICFVTAITGNYEMTAKSVCPQTVIADFIVYTDCPDTLQLCPNSPWKVCDIRPYCTGIADNNCNTDAENDPNLRNALCNNRHSFNTAKIVKMNLHRLPELSKYDIVIWMDATLELVYPRTAEICRDFIVAGRNIVLFEHEWRRGSLAAEVNASDWQRYTSTFYFNQAQPFQDVRGQYAHYLKEGFDESWIKKTTCDPREHLGVWITCFIAWDMRKQETHDFLNLWWLHNLTYTTQDQISFPYVCWKQRVIPTTLPDRSIDGTLIYGRGHERTLFYIKHNHGL
jgi:hypothetical protein